VKRRNFVSLFSGCGGFDLGFATENFWCEAAYDIDPTAVENHARNLQSPARKADLATYAVENDLNTSVDVIVAGSPCQGFSRAGKRDVEDPRNQLLLRAGQIALRIKPQAFIAENVVGVASGSHAKYWSGLQTMLRDAGYRTVVVKCDAHKLGVPQFRTRLLIVAWNTGRDFDVCFSEAPGTILRDVNSHCTEDDPCHPFPEGTPAYRIAARIRPGQKLSNVRRSPAAVHTWDIPEVFGPTSQTERQVLEALMILRRRDRRRPTGDADPVTASALSRFLNRSVHEELQRLLQKSYVKKAGKYFDLTHTFNGKYRRLSWDRPSFAVDTRFGDPRYFLHPDQNRGFSVREAARIQGFPDSFTFTGSLRDRYRMIGNAVPPPMAARIAEMIRQRVLV
jgi:DNA (cytosine-5)-methyltransferase 1